MSQNCSHCLAVLHAVFLFPLHCSHLVRTAVVPCVRHSLFSHSVTCHLARHRVTRTRLVHREGVCPSPRHPDTPGSPRGCLPVNAAPQHRWFTERVSARQRVTRTRLVHREGVCPSPRHPNTAGSLRGCLSVTVSQRPATHCRRLRRRLPFATARP